MDCSPAPSAAHRPICFAAQIDRRSPLWTRPWTGFPAPHGTRSHRRVEGHPLSDGCRHSLSCSIHGQHVIRRIALFTRPARRSLGTLPTTTAPSGWGEQRSGAPPNEELIAAEQPFLYVHVGTHPVCGTSVGANLISHSPAGIGV
eukprot:233693-Pleurochrysis_carterae.AAC.2